MPAAKTISRLELKHLTLAEFNAAAAHPEMDNEPVWISDEKAIGFITQAGRYVIGQERPKVFRLQNIPGIAFPIKANRYYELHLSMRLSNDTGYDAAAMVAGLPQLIALVPTVLGDCLASGPNPSHGMTIGAIVPFDGPNSFFVGSSIYHVNTPLMIPTEGIGIHVAHPYPEADLYIQQSVIFQASADKVLTLVKNTHAQQEVSGFIRLTPLELA